MIDRRFELAPGRINFGAVLRCSSQRGEQAALELFQMIDRHGMGSLALMGDRAAWSGQVYRG